MLLSTTSSHWGCGLVNLSLVLNINLPFRPYSPELVYADVPPLQLCFEIQLEFTRPQVWTAWNLLSGLLSSSPSFVDA